MLLHDPGYQPHVNPPRAGLPCFPSAHRAGIRRQQPGELCLRLPQLLPQGNDLMWLDWPAIEPAEVGFRSHYWNNPAIA